MAQFLRPDADLNLDGWTNPSFSVIDETSPSDADLTQSPSAPTNDALVVRLSDAEDPVSSAGHVVRYRYNKNAAGGAQIDITAELRQGYVSEGTPGTLIATWSHTNVSETFTTAAQTLSGPEADAITDYNDLALRFVANQV